MYIAGYFLALVLMAESCARWIKLTLYNNVIVGIGLVGIFRQTSTLDRRRSLLDHDVLGYLFKWKKGKFVLKHAIRLVIMMC